MKTITTSPINLKKAFAILFCFILPVCVINAQQISINQGSHIVMNGNVSLVINNAAFKNDGNFSAGTGTVKFSGSNDTSGSYLSGINNTTFYNLTVSKDAYGVSLKSAAAVRNTLTMNSGNLYTDSNLTIKSDALLTGNVAAVPAACKIIGKAKIERYISSKRAWRMLTAPLTDAGTIFNTWQNSGVYQKGINTFVTGPNASAANGLDVSPQNNVSMRTWNNTTQQFTNIINTNVSISAGNNGNADNTAYFIFIRGDRNRDNFNTANSNSTTLSSTGSLQTGTQNFSVSQASGTYTMVGNPYASPVDFSALSKSNVLNRFYVWDPTLNVLGGYVMMDDLTNSGTYSKSVSASTQTKEIQSGQAFFVQTKNNGPAVITFNESNKSSVKNNRVFRPAGSGASQFLRINLNIAGADSSLVLADGIFAEFNDNFSATVDLDDAAKFTNTNENISFLRNTRTLAAERRPTISEFDTLYLKLWKTTPRKYQFEIIPADFYGTDIFLQDIYMGTSTPVNAFGTTIFNFTIDGNTASADAGRFKIVFRKYVVLPVSISSVNATEKNSNVSVDWKVENEINIEKYEVEKSADGKNFATANSINVNGNNNSYNSYSWLHVTPVQGTNFYRIKIYDRSGKTTYSSIVKAVINKSGKTTMSIYPNPVKDNMINLQLGNQPKGTYQLRLTSSIGQVMYMGSMISNSGNGTLSVNIKAKLTAGIYQLEVITPENKKETQKVIIE